MVGHTLQHGGLAGATGAHLAGRSHVDTGFCEDLEDGAVTWHVICAAAACKTYVEATLGVGVELNRAEALDVQGTVGPVLASPLAIASSSGAGPQQ